jgi:small subunit ribosomal protein S20
MPNTKSAERRARASERKRLHNRHLKSGLQKTEKSYLATLAKGSKEEAAKALQSVHSALDKAVKNGVIKRPTADRRKSRLALRLAVKA